MLGRNLPSAACMGLIGLATGHCQTSMAQTAFPSDAQFAITYTFTTSTPASPIDVGDGRDLTVNRYLATTVNDAGRGFLHRVAGRCTNIRFTAREARTVDSTGYCNFKDAEGDLVYAEYRTNRASPASAIALTWTFKSGTGKYDGIAGTATDTNSNNLDDQGAYQATGRMTGSYRIRRSGMASEEGTHD